MAPTLLIELGANLGFDLLCHIEDDYNTPD